MEKREEVKNMKRDPLLYAIIGFIVGVVVIWFIATSAVNNNNTGMMGMMGIGQNRGNMMGSPGMGSSMNEMMESMEGKTGEDFDKAFMESMIIHHQGAIEMAQKARDMATHDEIKKMADDIISAQTSEIDMIKQWQKDWGY